MIKYSFLLITYNQERFVEEAFQSCISQTCGDYEIVISDDNSTDATYAVLERLVKNYRESGGEIPIILNKNERNLGIGGNFQKAAELRRGQWLLMAAGDDISLSTRIETIEKVIKRHPEVYGINTARYFVDERGETLEYSFKLGYLLGADSVWNRRVFSEFRPLDRRVMSEDHVLNLRALLLGGMIQVNTPTIKYRISSQNYSIHTAQNIIDAKQVEIKKMVYHLNLLDFRKDDIEEWKEKGHDDDILNDVQRKIQRETEDLLCQKESYTLFVETYKSGIVGKIKYLCSPSCIWLHSNILYRGYNLLKMYHLISEKPRRKVESWDVVPCQDDKEYPITIHDFVGNDKFELF